MAYKMFASIALTLAVTHAANSSSSSEDGSVFVLGGWEEVENMEEATRLVYAAVGEQETEWVGNTTEYKGNLCINEVEDIKEQVAAGMNYLATIIGCNAAPLSNGSCTDCVEDEASFQVKIFESLIDADDDTQLQVTSVSSD